MYILFIAGGDDEYGFSNKVHLVEWRTTEDSVPDVEEAFEDALDHYSLTKPYMGDWVMVTALSIQNGKIVPVESEKKDVRAHVRGARVINAVKYRMKLGANHA